MVKVWGKYCKRMDGTVNNLEERFPSHVNHCEMFMQPCQTVGLFFPAPCCGGSVITMHKARACISHYPIAMPHSELSRFSFADSERAYTTRSPLIHKAYRGGYIGNRGQLRDKPIRDTDYEPFMREPIDLILLSSTQYIIKIELVESLYTIFNRFLYNSIIPLCQDCNQNRSMVVCNEYHKATEITMQVGRCLIYGSEKLCQEALGPNRYGRAYVQDERVRTEVVTVLTVPPPSKVMSA